MKKLIILLMVLAIPFATFAKKDKGYIEKELQEYKIKFLAQEIDLRNDQRDKFIEVYSRMTDEKRKVFAPAMNMNKKVKNDANATKEEYRKANEMMTNAKVQEGKIDRKYESEFSKFLTQKQIYKMREAEKKFRKMLNETLKK